MDKPKIDPKKINLIDFRILKSSYEISPDHYNDYAKSDIIKCSASSELAYIADKGIARFRLFIKLDGVSKKSKPVGIVGEYGFEFHFEIENLEQFVENDHDSKKDEIKMSPLLNVTLAGISYSTARGVIINRTMATDFAGIIIPILNPADILSSTEFDIS
jgi:hypothetical protein